MEEGGKVAAGILNPKAGVTDSGYNAELGQAGLKEQTFNRVKLRHAAALNA